MVAGNQIGMNRKAKESRFADAGGSGSRQDGTDMKKHARLSGIGQKDNILPGRRKYE
jgi:hypothetical protein